MNGLKGLIFGAVLLAVMAVAMAAVVNVETVTEGTAETYPGAASPASSSINAGYVKEVNLAANVVTTRWAGFWGHFDANTVLADASSNIFYQWTGFTGTPVIYASDQTGIDWTTLAAATATDMNTAGFTCVGDNSYADSWTNTFTASESQTFNGTSITANYATTGGGFKVYSLKDGSTKLLWAVFAQQDVTGFNGVAHDFEVLVPVCTSPTTYYFYVELQ